MDSDDREPPRRKADQDADLEDEIASTPAAGAIIAANLAGVNAGSSTSATGAPATGAVEGVMEAKAEEEDEYGEDDSDVED